MRKTVRSILLPVAAVLMALALCACTGRSVSQEQMMEDIRKYDSYLDQWNMTMDSFQELERLTDSKQGTDWAKIAVQASCPEVSYRADYILSYDRFDQGWVCTGPALQNPQVRPLDLETHGGEDLEAWLVEHGYENIRVQERRTEGNDVYLTYAGDSDQNYAHTTMLATNTYRFSLETGWTQDPAPTTELLSLEPDVLGTWYFSGGDYEYTVEVLECDLQHSMLTIRCDLIGIEKIGADRRLVLREPTRVRMLPQTDSAWQVLLPGIATDMQMHLGIPGECESPITGETAEGAGLAIRGCWLERQAE